MFSLLLAQLIDQTPACLANCWQLEVALNSFPGAIHQPIDGVGERGPVILSLFVAGDTERCCNGRMQQPDSHDNRGLNHGHLCSQVGPEPHSRGQ